MTRMSMAMQAFLSRIGARFARHARVRILVRQSPDWRHTPYEELIAGSRAFCRLVGAAAGFGENFISDAVAVWDRTFATSYFHVRAAMKDIAQHNLREVRQALIEPVATAGAATQDLHVFIDDDDWLHPSLWRELQPQHGAQHDGYIFGNVLCVSRVELRRVEDGCYTNNYAVTGHHLRSLGGDCVRFAQHWDANEAFHQPTFRRSYVPRYLSATNKHPASAMKLKDGLQNAELSAQTLRRLVEKFVDESAQQQAPAQAQWVLPYTRRVRGVFADLL
jgi:hypothetical protein